MSFASAEIIVSGIVQGVGYRYFCLTQAQNLHINGWVKNLSNGNVMVFVQGDKNLLVQFCDLLKNGPANAHVDSLDIKWSTREPIVNSFKITH